MNVTTALSVSLYEYRRQHPEQPGEKIAAPPKRSAAAAAEAVEGAAVGAEGGPLLQAAMASAAAAAEEAAADSLSDCSSEPELSKVHPSCELLKQ